MNLYDEFFSIISVFNKHRVNYAVIGGIAMSFYANPRFTNDIDILSIPSCVNKIIKTLNGLDYEEISDRWTFKKTAIELIRFGKVEHSDFIPVDILIGSDDIHKEILKRSIRQRTGSGTVRLASVDDLIYLKKIRNSAQDKLDIKNLKKPDRT
jgi:Nucleotidyl transferase of unknown function (DUF2204)